MWLSSSEDETTAFPSVAIVGACDATNKRVNEFTSIQENENTNYINILNYESTSIQVANSNISENIADVSCKSSKNKSIANRNYYQKNAPRIREMRRKRYTLNDKQSSAVDYARQYRKTHTQEIKKRNFQYRRSHSKEIREYSREYYQSHSEEAREYSREYYQCHSEEAREYYQSHLEEAHEYYQSHSEEAREYYQLNRKRLLERAAEYDESEYRSDIREGPTFICISCGRLLFRRSVSLFYYKEMSKCTPEVLETTCPFMQDVDSQHVGYICSNCKKYLKDNKIPPLSLAHEELDFPEIPQVLADLKTIDERFLAPRIGFIQIRESFIDTQKKSKGRVVNVPTNPESSLRMLPRTYDNLGVILVKLKKRVAFKSSVWEETIRIDAIRKAAEFLKNSEVYRAEKITVNFGNFNDTMRETINSLIEDCDYDYDEERVNDRDSDDYSIVEVEFKLSLLPLPLILYDKPTLLVCRGHLFFFQYL